MAGMMMRVGASRIVIRMLNRYLCHPADGLARCGTDGSGFDCPVFSPDLLDAQAPAGSPDRVLDDLGREPMAAITGQGHADILPYSATDPVSVTVPQLETGSRSPTLNRSSTD